MIYSSDICLDVVQTMQFSSCTYSKKNMLVNGRIYALPLEGL